MQTQAIVLEEPRRIASRELSLLPKGAGDVMVAVDWSSISTGTERLLYTGAMPAFPGMGYPLVPGYEAVGRVVESDEAGTLAIGQHVFVPGANCYDGARGLFGAAASKLVVPTNRVLPISADCGEKGVLFALAATAHHTLGADGSTPDLIVGHGTLGRLLARIVLATGAPAPTVWETNPKRVDGAIGYTVVHPGEDPRRDYKSICDVSGANEILDTLIARLAPGGEICIAGFYSQPLSFTFPPAFMREARLRVAAQWKPDDLVAVKSLVEFGALSFDGLLTHRTNASDASRAYETAFGDPDCLKMVLDWRHSS